MRNKSIIVENLSKRYTISENNDTLMSYAKSIIKKKSKKEFWALKDVSFEIEKGETIGIIGSNGAGKSTLLKILSRITPPTSGKATINGSVSSLLEVGTGFHPELTGRENIYLNGSILGMGRGEITSKLEEIIDFSGIEEFIDMPVKHYSSGMYVRLAFSVAAHLDSDILLVDEVLAVGDVRFQEKCLNKINEFSIDKKQTVLFVSHNLGIIRQICKNLILLEKGKIVGFGESNSVIKKYLHEVPEFYVSDNENSIKSISIDYSKFLNILIEYNFEKIIFPNIAFIISNKNGQNLFGSSTRHVDYNLKAPFPNKGKINIEVNNIKLRSGDYFLSIWFGPREREHTFIKEKIVKFRVNSEYDETISTNIHNYGNIIPDCKINIHEA